MEKARKDTKKIFVLSNFRAFVIKNLFIKSKEITIKILTTPKIDRLDFGGIALGSCTI